MRQPHHFDSAFPPWRAAAVVFLAAAAFLAAPLHAAEPADRVFLDGPGRVVAMALEDEWVGVHTDIVVALPDWSRSIPLAPENVSEVKVSREGRQRVVSGRITAGPGAVCAYRETVTETEAGATLDISFTAETDMEIEGIYLFLKVPVAVFAGTPCSLETNGVAQATAFLPATMEADSRFLKANAGKVILGAAGRARLEAELDAPRDLWLQDERHWGGDFYSAFTQICAGPLAKNQTASIRLKLALTGHVPRDPAKLTVSPRQKLYAFDGIGANFVHGIDSPAAGYVAEHLRLAWVRTRMSLAEWEPENDNADPGDTNWAALEARDKPGSPLRREFEFARDLRQRGSAWCISVWDLPEWLYAQPSGQPGLSERRVPPEKWPELLEAIGSYLLYAKRHYGSEPDLFSFNAPDSGDRVLFHPEEHADAIKLLGAHFAKLGLKTKLLLGDVNVPRRSLAYVIPATQDPEARRYVGAVAFQSWGGGSTDEYQAWAALARELNLPLLVTETGVEAEAWRTPAEIQSFYYAVQELHLCQELLLHAAPQALLHWEAGGDYAAVQETKDAAGKAVLVPGWRFAFLRHFCDLTPPKATALDTTSDQPDVFVTAFAADQDGKRRYTLHIANLGPARPATLEGLPLTVTRFRAVRTARDETFRELEPVEVRDGRAEFTLAPQSLLTLTTLPTPSAAAPAKE